jgi:oligoendopeptidase F
MESNNPAIRELAFKTLYKAYIAQKNTITETYKSSVKKDVFVSKARKYDSSIQAALDTDDVDIAVYDNLIASVEAGLPAMYRYLDLRKQCLGLDELHMYDIYVPLIEEPDIAFDFEASKAIVEKGLVDLGEDYLKVLREGYNDHWIDVVESEGKTGGAYSWGAYGSHPYVLLNHRDTLDGVLTLAHEMGHAIHSYFSNEALPYMKAQYRIFVAEVASTLNEILLTRYLIKTLKDPMQKAYIINQYLEQFRGTVFRQTMFAKFEKETHAMAERGDVLTADGLNKLYLDLNKQYYGPNMVHDEEIASEWMRIPHFYNAFYVYKYATGFSAAAAIAERIITEGQPAVDDYLKFLSTGGSDYPIELLKIAGVDMSKPDTVNKAMTLFESMLDEFETLVKKK